MDRFNITKPADLEQAIIEYLVNPKIDLIVDASFKMTLKIYGDNWDGRINSDVAKFIVDFQEMIYKLYAVPLGIPVSKINAKIKEDLKVYVYVSDGCTYLEVAREVIRELIKGMSSEDKKKVILYFLAAGITIYSVMKFDERMEQKIASEERLTSQMIESKERLETKKLEGAEKEKLTSIIEMLIHDKADPKEIKELNKAVDKAVRSPRKILGKKDKIRINDEPKEISRNQFVRRTIIGQKEKNTYFIDSDYYVTSIEIEDGKRKASLKIDDITFNAQISPSIKDEKLDLLWTAEKTGTLITLNIDADIRDGEARNSIIQGFEKPRENSIAPTDVLY